jgi:serine/threonine protein kinase
LSADIKIGDFDGGSTTLSAPRGGLLMKHYQGTLAQCKIPLTEEVLLRLGKCLKTAIRTLHRAGFCHMDIKPSNIFLFEEECFLGDYGAAVKIGEPLRERTYQYYPGDGEFEGREETDFYLLAVTLLEMFGSISSPQERKKPLSKSEIHSRIDVEENENVRNFLKSLFDQN